MKKIIVFLVSFLSIAGTLQAKHKPVFYVQTKSISGLSNEFNELLTRLDQNITLAQLKILRIRLQPWLDKSNLKLNGLAIAKPIRVAATLDPEALAKVAKASSQGNPDAFSMYFRYTISIPVADRFSFDKFIVKAMKDSDENSYDTAPAEPSFKKVGEYTYEFVDGSKLKIASDQAYFYNGKSPLDVEDIVESIDDGNDAKYPSNIIPLVFMKANPDLLDELYSNSMLQGFFTGFMPMGPDGPMMPEKKAPPGSIQPIPPYQPDNYGGPFGGGLGEGVMSYVGQLYMKFSQQANKLSPRFQAGWLYTKWDKNTLTINVGTQGDLKNREFLKEFYKRYDSQIGSDQAKGQVKLDVDDSLVHITTPIGMKEFIDMLNHPLSGEIFLVRDFYQALFILSDVITLSDTKETVWKAFRGGLDLIVWDVPTWQERQNISKYKFAILADLSKGHGMKAVMQSIQKLGGEGQSIMLLKGTDSIYQVPLEPKLSLYFGIGPELLIISTDLATVKKLYKRKPSGYYSRASISFPKNDVGDSQPMAFRVNFKELRAKLLTGQMNFMQQSSLMMPNLNALQIDFVQNRSGKNKVDGKFRLKIEFNPNKK